MKNLKQHISDLHGKTVKHGVTGHGFTLRKSGDHEYDLYRGDKFVGTINARSEEAVLHILQQKGYDIHE